MGHLNVMCPFTCYVPTAWLERLRARDNKQTNTSGFEHTVKEKYDLAVAYRIYPRISKEMAVYPQDKLKLSEICLRSFRESLGSLKVKMWVLLDNCPPEYEALFLKYFDKRNLEIVKLGGVGNQATFGLQMELLANQNDSEFIYFAEDDYLFLPNQFAEMIYFLKCHLDVHFVSPYDHPDYYTMKMHDHKYEIRAFGTHHWRTAAATTLSFLTTKQILAKTRNALDKYCKSKAPDYSIWMSISKFNVLNPSIIVKLLVSNRMYFNMFYWTWIHCWKQILFGNKRKLWVSIPSIATHMEKKFLSPCIKWEEEGRSIEQSFLREQENNSQFQKFTK